MQSSLCLVGLRDVLGSSFLDLQSQVFSDSMTHILAHVSFVGQLCERFVALQLFFSPSGAPRCGSLPSVPPRGGSAVSGSPLSGEHSPVSCCAPLFAALPNGAPTLRRDAPFCFAGPLGAPQFPCGSGSSATRVLLCAFSQFPSASSSLSPCSLGREALVSTRLC